MGLVDRGDALCKGREGADVGFGIEGFAFNGLREGLVARIWRVIQHVEIRGLVECENDGRLV